MPVANDTPEEEEYEVMGGGGLDDERHGCLDSCSIDTAAEQGTGPWQVTFRGDPKLRVTLNNAEDTALLYEDGNSGFRVKVLKQSTCQLSA